MSAQSNIVLAALSTHFPAGDLFITTNAKAKLTENDTLTAIARHLRCDWGNLCRHDRLVNEEALANGERLSSVYRSEAGEEFWIMTEWDRSYTTILMPSDY